MSVLSSDAIVVGVAVSMLKSPDPGKATPEQVPPLNVHWPVVVSPLRTAVVVLKMIAVTAGLVFIPGDAACKRHPTPASVGVAPGRLSIIVAGKVNVLSPI